MTIFKTEVYVELEYEHLCHGCPFYDYMGGNFRECSATKQRWQSEQCTRPDWCPLREVEEM